MGSGHQVFFQIGDFKKIGDFPGHPVVKTPLQGLQVLILGQETKILHAL